MSPLTTTRARYPWVHVENTPVDTGTSPSPGVTPGQLGTLNSLNMFKNGMARGDDALYSGFDWLASYLVGLVVLGVYGSLNDALYIRLQSQGWL